MKTNTAKALLFTFVPALIILGLIASIKIFSDHTLLELASDVSEVAALHPFAGILSNLGILLWCSSASVLLFTSALVYKAGSQRMFIFFLVSSLATLYLLADDLFSVHEMLGPSYLGVDEKYIYLAIATMAVLYALYFFRLLVSGTYSIFFFISVSFLAFSMLCDSLLKSYLPALGDWRHLLEEGTKWLGICGWSAFFILTSFDYLKNYSILKEEAVS